MIKAAIFDFDGTLVDLFDEHLIAFQEVIKRHFNLDFSREDLDAGYGMIGEDILRMFFRKHHFKVSEEDLQKIITERRILAADRINKKVNLLPGAEKLLDALRGSGFKIAIATSCSKRVCEGIFAMPKFRRWLDSSITGSEVEKGKPDPEIFLKAAERLGVSPDECVVFEDSPYGIQAAKKAGMKVIAVSSGHDPKEKLMKEKPDRIVESLLEIGINDLKI